jgi:hypothetical protein
MVAPRDRVGERRAGYRLLALRLFLLLPSPGDDFGRTTA